MSASTEDRKLDIEVAKLLGFEYAPGPTYDYDGPVDQPPILMPPGGVSDSYVYPPRGVISPAFFVPFYSTDKDQTLALLKRGIWKFGKCDCRMYLGGTKGSEVIYYDVMFGDTVYASNTDYGRAVCHAFIAAIERT